MNKTASQPTGRPSGKVNHWGDRVTYYKRALAALNVEVSEEMAKTMNQQIESHQGKNHKLPAEPSYLQWKAEQRAKRKGAGRDD